MNELTSTSPISIYDAISELSLITPNNQYKLPEGFYRADLLNFNTPSSSPTQSSQELTGSGSGATAESLELPLKVRARHAYVPLDYSDGYPTLPDGTPFWFQLPHEPSREYEIFQYYMALPQLRNSVRLLADFPSILPEHLKAHLDQSKNQNQNQNQASSQLQELRILFYWDSRAKAYDAFDTIVRRRQRSAHANDAEDRHFHMSELLLKKVMSFIQSDSFLDGMNTKTAIEGLKLGISLQRQSLGLAPNAAQERAPQLDMQLELHRTMHPESTDFHGNVKKAEDLITLPDGTEILRGTPSSRVQEVLKDPDALRMAERLVIKMSSNQTALATSS